MMHSLGPILLGLIFSGGAILAVGSVAKPRKRLCTTKLIPTTSTPEPPLLLLLEPHQGDEPGGTGSKHRPRQFQPKESLPLYERSVGAFVGKRATRKRVRRKKKFERRARAS